MEVLIPGHHYSVLTLDPIESGLDQEIKFVMRNNPPEKYPGNYWAFPGTTTQELLRVIIDRAKYVDNQFHSGANLYVITYCRASLRVLEERAAAKHGRWIQTLRVDIENEPICLKCGHIECEEHK